MCVCVGGGSSTYSGFIRYSPTGSSSFSLWESHPSTESDGKRWKGNKRKERKVNLRNSLAQDVAATTSLDVGWAFRLEPQQYFGIGGGAFRLKWRNGRKELWFWSRWLFLVSDILKRGSSALWGPCYRRPLFWEGEDINLCDVCFGFIALFQAP